LCKRKGERRLSKKRTILYREEKGKKNGQRKQKGGEGSERRLERRRGESRAGWKKRRKRFRDCSKEKRLRKGDMGHLFSASVAKRGGKERQPPISFQGGGSPQVEYVVLSRSEKLHHARGRKNVLRKKKVVRLFSRQRGRDERKGEVPSSIKKRGAVLSPISGGSALLLPLRRNLLRSFTL